MMVFPSLDVLIAKGFIREPRSMIAAKTYIVGTENVTQSFRMMVEGRPHALCPPLEVMAPWRTSTPGFAPTAFGVVSCGIA